MRHNSFRLLDPSAPVKPSKYRSKKVVLDGETFDSKAECNRYANLKLMQRAGLICDLRRQVKFVLAPSVMIKGEKRATPALCYTADFGYTENGEPVVEDTKGFLTPVYKIKRHLMKSVHGIDIKETK